MQASIQRYIDMRASLMLRGKKSTCKAGDSGPIPGSGRSPGGGQGNPLQYSCLENLTGQRSLVGYSPWGHTKLDMTVTKHTQNERFKQ